MSTGFKSRESYKRPWIG